MKATTIQLFILTAVSLASVQAAPARKLVDKGNSAYQAGEYDKAFSLYEEASVEAPESASLYFNKGLVHYRKENYGDAVEAFQEAALRAKEPEFTAQAKYNLGNCAFRQAERQRDSDLGKAIESCQTSINRYQEALELNPEYQEAAENIEIVRLYIKTLLDEQKKQQEQQKQQQDQDQQKQQDQQQQQQQQQQSGEDQQQEQGKEQQQQKEDQSEGEDESQEQQQQNAGEEESQSDEEQEQEAAALPATDDTARDILNEEKENQQRRRPVRVGGGRPVDKDW